MKKFLTLMALLSFYQTASASDSADCVEEANRLSRNFAQICSSDNTAIVTCNNRESQWLFITRPCASGQICRPKHRRHNVKECVTEPTARTSRGR